MQLPFRARLEYLFDGTVLEGQVDQRLYALATARVVLDFGAADLPLAVMVDVAQYGYDDESLDLLVPLLAEDWIEIPLRVQENPRLLRACETGEIQVRLVTSTQERVLRATHIDSDRWRSDDLLTWTSPRPRRLLIQLGRDGEPSTHPAATKVREIQQPDGEVVILLQNVVLPGRSTCLYCRSATPDTREHVLPNWATGAGETGMTTDCCDSCNSRLSNLESRVADISRQGHTELDLAERALIGTWAIKTIWALGESLGTDPLRGAGDPVVAELVGATADTTTDRHRVTDIYTSVESAPSASFLRYSAGDDAPSWAMLRVQDLVTSIWIKPTERPR